MGLLFQSPLIEVVQGTGAIRGTVKAGELTASANRLCKQAHLGLGPGFALSYFVTLAQLLTVCGSHVPDGFNMASLKG